MFLRKSYNWIFTLLIIFVFTGCTVLGVTPETNYEKLFQLKATYSEVLDLTLKYQKEGLLTEDQESKLSKAFKDFHSAELLADTALNLKDTLIFDNQMTTMVSVIRILNVIINKTKSTDKGVYNVNSNRPTSKRFITGLFKYCVEISRRPSRSEIGWSGSGCGRISSNYRFKREQTVAFRS